MDEPIQIAIVSNDEQSRQTARQWLDGADNVQIVGERQGGPEAIPWLRQVRAEVVLLDIEALAAAELREAAAQVQVIVLHLAGQEPEVLEALRAGARGHLDKENTRPSQAVAAVRAVSRGEAVVSPTVAGLMLDEVMMALQGNRKGGGV